MKSFYSALESSNGEGHPLSVVWTGLVPPHAEVLCWLAATGLVPPRAEVLCWLAAASKVSMVDVLRRRASLRWLLICFFIAISLLVYGAPFWRVHSFLAHALVFK